MIRSAVDKVKQLFSRGEDATARRSGTRGEEYNRLYELTRSDPFQALLNDYIYAGKRRTTNFLEMYRTAIRYTYGDQIHQKRQSGWEYPIINILFPTLMQEVGFLAAENPRIKALPVENTDKEIADAASGVLNGHWSQTLNMQMKTQQALIDGHLAGWYVGFGRWNPQNHWSRTQQRWIGEIDFNIINPRYFGCDEECELAADIPQKANFIFFDYYMDKRQAIKEFPFYRHWLEQEKHEEIGEYWIPGGGAPGDPVSTSQTHTERFDANLDWIGPDQIAKNKDLLQRRLSDILCGDAPGNHPSERHVRIQMILYRHSQDESVAEERRPFTPEEIRAGEAQKEFLGWDEGAGQYLDLKAPQIDENTGEYNGRYAAWDDKNKMPDKKVRDSYDRPRYSTGRWTVRLDNEVIVEDKPFPYERWPIAVGVNYLLPHVWQGLNSIEMGLNMQDYYNNLYTHILNNVRHHSDTQWVVEEDALAKDKNNPEESLAYIPNSSGSVIRVVAGAISRIRREPPVGMPSWIENLDPMLYRRFQDLQGMQDPAMGKGSAEQKTFRGLRMLNQNTQIRIGLQETSLHRFLTQTGYIFTELMAEHYTDKRWVRHLGTDRKSVMASMQWTKDMAKARYDLEMVAHSTLPYDEQEEKGLYMKLAELMGRPMFETMLEKLGIEEVDDILLKDAILGPLTQLLEMAQENNLPPEAIMQAVQAQLEQLTSQLQPAGQQPGGQTNGQERQRTEAPGS